MNIVLGVDQTERVGTPSFAAALLRRLHFPQAGIEVVHVLTPTLYDDWAFGGGTWTQGEEAADRAVREQAQTRVNEIAAQLREAMQQTPPEDAGNSFVHAHLEDALSVADCLVGYADQKKADLIAVDGPHEGPLREFLTGSVARSLVIGSHERSLLLAKDPQPPHGTMPRTPAPKDALGAGPPDGNTGTVCEWPAPHGPIRAVFATDHSPYADHCLKKLFHLAPRGISHITVLTVYPEAELTDVGRFLPNLATHPATAVRQLLTEQNDEVLQKLAPLLEANGAKSESRVIGGAVNDVIAQTMEETRADLLIVGARGHGFMERLTVGSVSFHQAMTAPYSILILRA